MDPFCILSMSVMLSCLFIAALWSPAGKRAKLLALLYVMFSCVFVTIPCGVLSQVWYLIVSIPDLCLLPYFKLQAVLQIYSKYDIDLNTPRSYW